MTVRLSLATHVCNHLMYAQEEPAARALRKITCFMDLRTSGFGLGSSKYLFPSDFYLKVVKIRLAEWKDVKEILG